MVNNEQEFFTAVRENDISTVQNMLRDNICLLNSSMCVHTIARARACAHLPADRRLPACPCDEQMRPLFIAVQHNSFKMVELLVHAGANINMNSENEWSALSGAASYGNSRIVSFLINNGANVNIEEEEGESPLYIAANNGYTRVVRLLIDAGANINKENDNGMSALSGAASRGWLQIVELLIEKGANINGITKEGFSPLLSAVFLNKNQSVKLLLENGADVYKKGNILGARPLTPLMMAITNLRVRRRVRSTDGIAKINEIIKMIRDTILSNAAKDAILVAEEKDMIQDEAFLIFKKFVKTNMEEAGDSDYNVDNADLYNYFEKIKKIRIQSSMTIMKRRRVQALCSTTGGSRSRTKSGKRKSKRLQRRPPNAVCTRAQKLGIRLTVKRNNKRVYKTEEVLRTQIKNAVNRQKRKK